MPRVVAVIVNYNGGDLVRESVRSLVSQEPPVDVLVLDNDSRDGSADVIEREFPTVRVQRTGANLGVIAQNALLDEPHEYFFIFNPDAFAEPDAVAALVRLMDADPQLALLGATLVEWDRPDVVQSFAKTIDPVGFPFDALEGQPVAALPDRDVVSCFYATSAAILVRASDFRAVGGLDETFFMFTDETDLAWRLQLRGRAVAVTPRVRVRHVGGASAPAGTSEGRYRTSLFRIYLRERNCAAMCLKCYGGPLALAYLLAASAELALEALVLLVLGKREIVQTYARAARDLWAQRRDLLRRRRAVQQTRVVGDAVIMRRMYPGFAKLAMLRRVGLPVVAGAKRT